MSDVGETWTVDVEEVGKGTSGTAEELFDNIRIKVQLQWQRRIRVKGGLIYDIEAVWDGNKYVLGEDGVLKTAELRMIQEKVDPRMGMVGGDYDGETYKMDTRMVYTLMKGLGGWVNKTIGVRAKSGEIKGREQMERVKMGAEYENSREKFEEEGERSGKGCMQTHRNANKEDEGMKSGDMLDRSQGEKADEMNHQRDIEESTVYEVQVHEDLGQVTQADRLEGTGSRRLDSPKHDVEDDGIEPGDVLDRSQGGNEDEMNLQGDIEEPIVNEMQAHEELGQKETDRIEGTESRRVESPEQDVDKNNNGGTMANEEDVGRRNEDSDVRIIMRDGGKIGGEMIGRREKEKAEPRIEKDIWGVWDSPVKDAKSDNQERAENIEMDTAGGGEEKLNQGRRMGVYNNMMEWINENQRGYQKWLSIILMNEEKLLVEWPMEMAAEEDYVRWAIRDPAKDFWYARVGNDAIVAVRVGSAAHGNMERIIRALVTRDEERQYFPGGAFQVMEEEHMEMQWYQEVVNLATKRGLEDEQIDALFGIKTVKPRYTVVIHMDKGLVDYPDEIEWRRRDEEMKWRKGKDHWVFCRYEDWVIASIDDKPMEEVVAKAEDIVSKMRKERIGPDTDEYGSGEDMERKDGLQLLGRINEDGTLKGINTEEGAEWNFNQTINVVGAGEKEDGVMMAEVRFMIKDRYADDQTMRSQQFVDNAKIELKMYKLKNSNNVEKGANIALDFNEESDHVWIRTRDDRAGERWLRVADLDRITSEEKVIIGYRNEGRVRKLRIGTGGIKEIADQIKRKAKEWGTSITVWGERPREVIDIDEQEREVELQQEETIYPAVGCLIFGFTTEMIKALGNEEIVNIATDRAKQGIKGNIQVRRGEIKKRIEADKGFVTINNLGLDGVRSDRVGVIVEFVNEVMVGKTDGHGIAVYDWGKVKREGRKSYNISLSRQMMRANEMSMLIRASIKRQDFAVAAARGLLKSSVLDDILRRSFQGFLENEIGVKVMVWVMSIRHPDDTGRPRDEAIMVGMVPETGGRRLSDGMRIFANGSKRCMIMMEGIDIQVFKDGRAIWNTSKPSMVGRVDRVIEVIGPPDRSTKEVMDALREVGVMRINMMARNTKIGSIECWMVVPGRGEKVGARKSLWTNKHGNFWNP